MKYLETPVLLVGGGIAGLWLLAALRAKGIPAWLLEADAIGCNQTLASQGIIHGGSKYALLGKLSDSALALSAMPMRWKHCLAGKGTPDLSEVKILSPYQYLWSPGSMASRLVGFFADQAMGEKMERLTQEKYPEILRQQHVKGAVYRLDEPVLDVYSLLQQLLKTVGQYCIKIDAIEWIDPNNDQLCFRQDDENYQVTYQKLLLTAGQGNQKLLSQAHLEKPQMQLRPLKMVMLKGDLPDFYAHALGAKSVPKITIGSVDWEGEKVWYLGGQLAEDGVEDSDDLLISKARSMLQELLPAIDFSDKVFACLSISRAELLTKTGSKPDMPTIITTNNITTIWPTKLAFSPLVADEVIQNIHVSDKDSGVWHQLTKAILASPPWGRAKWN